MHDPDPKLSNVLKTWKHDPAPAPGFTDTVWSRIHRDAPAQTPVPAPAHILRFPLPLSLAASISVILAVLAGTGAGLALNHSRATDRMAAAYVRSIDPLQMTATPPASHSHS